MNRKNLMYISDPSQFCCVSTPYYECPKESARGEITLTDEVLEKAVDEVMDAGVDIFVNEIYGMVPWYPSRVYSLQEHFDWFYNQYGGTQVCGVMNFAAAGGDLVRVQGEQVHRRGGKYYLSYRINDHHGMCRDLTPRNVHPRLVSKFYAEHPEYRINAPQPNYPWAKYHLDFRFREVIDYKLRILAELIENYDIDGLMVDFLRTSVLFNQELTTLEERETVITDFFREIRGMLKEKEAKTGKHCRLGAKIPMDVEGFALLGINIRKLTDAGVEFFSVFDYFCTRQKYDVIDLVKAESGGKQVFLEMSQATTWRKCNGMRLMRLSTSEQLATTAYAAYGHGADGITLFNFPWYRAGNEVAFEKLEPPFGMFNTLKNESLLGTLPQYYFEAATENMIPHGNDLQGFSFVNGSDYRFDVDVRKPSGGYTEDGVFCLESVQNLENVKFEVRLNGEALRENNDLEELYPIVYRSNLAQREQRKRYAVPMGLLKEGKNTVSVRCLTEQEEAIHLFFMGILIR